MPANLDILINAKDEASAQIEGVGESLGGLDKAGQSAGLSLTDLKSGLDLAKMAFGAVQGAIKSVIDPTVEYAGEVRTLGRTIGSTAEESSKLIQAADDVGISAGTLQSALEAAIKKGVKPSIEGIGKLADQYNAIQDPIEKTKFLMDNFGRAGADLAPLMEEGAAGIRAAGDEAERLGLVMDQDGVDSARRYEIAMDDFGDSVMAVKLAIAENLLPAVTELISTGSEQISLWKNIGAAVSEGRLSFLDYLKASAEVVWTDKTLADVNDELTGSTVEMAAATNAAAARYQGLADQYDTTTTATVEYSNQIQSQTGWLNELVPAIDNTRMAGELLAAGLSGTLTVAQETYKDAVANTVPVISEHTGWLETMRAKQADAEAQLKLTTSEFLYQQVAAHLDTGAQLELANQLGLIDDTSYNAAVAMQELTAKYDTNHDGTVSAAEATKAYKDEVIALRDGITSLADKTVNIRINTVYQDQYLDAYRAATGGGRAAGGPITGGTAYMVGERGPELVIPSGNGNVMNNDLLSKMVNALDKIASGGQTVNYYGYGGEVAAGQTRAQAGAF